jgi:hypothetical protein
MAEHKSESMSTESRSVAVTLPGGASPIIIDDVPPDTTFGQFKICLYSQSPVDLSPCRAKGTSGKIYTQDDDLIEDSSIEFYIPDAPPKTDLALPILFWLLHSIPIIFILKQKGAWQILNAEILALVSYGFVWFIWKRILKAKPLLPIPEICWDLWALFKQSLPPSFRIEHLVQEKQD